MAGAPSAGGEKSLVPTGVSTRAPFRVAVATFAGPVWSGGDAEEGFVRIQSGRVVEAGAGTRGGAKTAVILDGLHNYHTHIGDAFLHGKPLPRTLEALVRPVTGYKHRMLARATPRVLIAAMRRALRSYADAGTASLLDFREQGARGVRLAREASRVPEPASPVLRLLGRPAQPTSSKDLEDVVELADGIGAASLTDLGPEAGRYAEAARRHGKPFAIHASEQRREDMKAILDLRPDALVHLVHATVPDLRAVSKADVPVVLCPTSNRFFGLTSPVGRVRRAGLRFFFGTDNAMLGSYDLLREARAARRLDRTIPDADLLRALTTPPEKAIKRIQRVPEPPGGPPRLVVLPLRRGKVQWEARPVLARR